MTARCEKTDLLVDQCAHCRGDELLGNLDDVNIVAVFTARHAGSCDRCDAWFAAGDQIGRTDDGDYLGPCCLLDSGSRR